RIVRIEPVPGDVARSAQADAVGFVAITELGVVAGGRIGTGVARHPLAAVQEVPVLVDAEAEVAPDQAVIGRVGVRARVTEAPSPGAEAVAIAAAGAGDGAGVQLARVHQVETDAVRAVLARAAGVTEIGDGPERNRDAGTGREGLGENDAAVLAE